MSFDEKREVKEEAKVSGISTSVRDKGENIRGTDLSFPVSGPERLCPGRAELPVKNITSDRSDSGASQDSASLPHRQVVLPIICHN